MKKKHGPLHHRILVHLHRILDRVRGKIPHGAKARSSLWYGVAKAFRARPGNNECACCPHKTTLNVHHIRPYHLHPELELEPTNFITLCRVCHLLLGHLDNWHSFNVGVQKDAAGIAHKIATRPAG